MENKGLEQKLSKMREALKKKNVVVIDDVIPGHPAYGFLESYGSGEEGFLYAFYYQDHSKFSDEFLEPFREEGLKIENCEDLAKACIDPKTNYFYESAVGKFVPSKDIKRRYECLKMDEEEFRKRTGIGNADGVIVLGRTQSKKDEKIRNFIHEGFHGIDIDYELPEMSIGQVDRHFNNVKASEVLTDMRMISYLGDLKTKAYYIRGDEQTYDYIKKLLAGKGNLITENQKVLGTLYNQFSHDNVFQDFAVSQLNSELGAKENLKSFKTALECMAFGKPLNSQKV